MKKNDKQGDVLERIRAAVTKGDPELQPDDPAYQAAVILLASANVGPDDSRVSRLTGYPLALVQELGDRLRKSRVWHKGKVCCDWDDPKTGGVAFWMDVTVALGWLKRA